MDFILHGSSTPSAHGQHHPGSARNNRPVSTNACRPASAKPTVTRNPITVRNVKCQVEIFTWLTVICKCLSNCLVVYYKKIL